MFARNKMTKSFSKRSPAYWKARKTRGQHTFERYSNTIVSPKALEAYRDRPFNDYSWLKDLPDRRLAQEVQAAGIRFPEPSGNYSKPFRHQLVCALIGAAEHRFLFYLDPAAGKTLISLVLIEHYSRISKALPALVLIPSPTGADVWMEQIDKFSPNMRVVDLTSGSVEERFEAADSDADIFLLNYDGLVAMVADLQQVEGRKEKKKRVLIPAKVGWFVKRFRGVVLDEVHHVGASTSPIVFQACCGITSQSSFVYGLTGTPHGRDPGKVFQQFRVVDKGETFGETIGMFRRVFYKTTLSRWGHLEHEFDADTKPLLSRMVRNKAIRYEDREYSDLPPILSVPVPVRLSADARKAYDDLRRKEWEKADDGEARENVFMKGRQIASGFLYLDKVDGLPGRPFARIGKSNRRLDALQDILEELAEGYYKAIVFHEFVASGDMIEERLKSMKVKYTRLGVDKDASRMFREDKSISVVLAQCQSGEMHNWQVAGNIIFFESTVRPDIRIQCEARARRPGNTQRVRVFDLLPARTVEEKVLRYVKEGKDLMKEILSGSEGI